MEQAAQRCCWRTVWDFSFLADWKTTSRPPWDIVLSIWEIFEHSPWRVQCYSSGFFVSEAWKSCFGASSRKIWKNKFEWAIDKPYLLLYILISHTVQSFILPLFVVIICKFCFFFMLFLFQMASVCLHWLGLLPSHTFICLLKRQRERSVHEHRSGS